MQQEESTKNLLIFHLGKFNRAYISHADVKSYNTFTFLFRIHIELKATEAKNQTHINVWHVEYVIPKFEKKIVQYFFQKEATLILSPLSRSFTRLDYQSNDGDYHRYRK